MIGLRKSRNFDDRLWRLSVAELRDVLTLVKFQLANMRREHGVHCVPSWKLEQRRDYIQVVLEYKKDRLKERYKLYRLVGSILGAVAFFTLLPYALGRWVDIVPVIRMSDGSVNSLDYYARGLHYLMWVMFAIALFVVVQIPSIIAY